MLKIDSCPEVLAAVNTSVSASKRVHYLCGGQSTVQVTKHGLDVIVNIEIAI